MKRKVWLYTVLIITLTTFILTISCTKRHTRNTSNTGGAAASGDTQGVSEQNLDAEAEAERQRKLLEEQELADAKRQEEAQAAREAFVNEDIYFDFDSATIGSAAQEILTTKVEWMQDNPDTVIVVEGHCDNRGTTAYNLALGERRAEMVKNFLLNAGITMNRITTLSFGEERPIDTGENEDAWARNRRAHFVIE